MTQLDGLTDWFSRLYGAEAGARMAAACMENGLEKTVVEYGHDPTIKELQPSSRLFAPALAEREPAHAEEPAGERAAIVLREGTPSFRTVGNHAGLFWFSMYRFNVSTGAPPAVPA